MSYSGSIATKGMFGLGRQTERYNKQLWTPEQQKISKELYNQITGKAGTGATPYDQPRVAGASAPEATSLQQLQAYQNMPTLVQPATAAVTRALTGQGYSNIIDPERTNQLYASIEKQTLKDILPKVIEQTASDANVAGMFRSGKHARQQFENVNEVTNELMRTLAELKYQDELQRRGIEQGREERQLAAVPQASTAQGLPLQQVAAGQEFGSLPRSLEQAKLDTGYEEFLRTAPENDPWLAMLYEYLNLRGQESGKSTIRQRNMAGQLNTAFSYGGGGGMSGGSGGGGNTFNFGGGGGK